MKSNRIEITHEGKVPNPLDIFPSKSDSLTSAFFDVSVPKRKRRLEAMEKWLNPNEIKPEFGIKGDSQEVYIRRTFRRVGSSQLFNPMNPSDINLSDLTSKNNTTKKDYVLIEKSRLSELTKFEDILREEKAFLGEQCAWVMSDVKYDLNIPIPATRLAMHNICESKMRKVAAQILELNEKWKAYSKSNHFDRNPVYTKDSYLKSAPLSQRALKLKLFREACEQYRLRRDRDTMLYEDDLSYLIGKYQDARERKVDYDRYFILSTRFGQYKPEEFYKDNTPGFRYWKRVTIAAVKFQKLWNKYWSVSKIRRYLSSREIQKVWRRYWALKVWRPIIKMRLKMGKRTYYRFCWNLWLHYNKIVKKIKEAIKYYKQNSKGICFYSWKKHTADEKERKATVLKNFVFRIKYGHLMICYRAWVEYKNKCISIKRKAKRMFKNPCFDTWLRYTEWSKYMKKLNRSTARIQSVVRMRFLYIKYKRMKKALAQILKCIKVFKAFVVVKRMRRMRLEKDYIEWKPGAHQRKIAQANNKEKHRLIKLQVILKEKEPKVLNELKKHLRSSDGRFQIKQMARKYMSISKTATMEEAKKIAEKDLILKCSEANNTIFKHDFNTKGHIPTPCVNPFCNATFTSNDQYYEHFNTSDFHESDRSSLYVELHLLMRNPKGVENLNNFFSYKCGISNVTNSLDLWISIQEYRKILSTDVNYYKKINSIYEQFIRNDADRKVNFTFKNDTDNTLSTGLNSVLKKIEAVKYREFDGFYHYVVADKSMLRLILAQKGREYVAWTDDSVMLPSDFNLLEWLCFNNVYQSFCQNYDEFQTSSFGEDYKKILKLQETQNESQLHADFLEYRTEFYLNWAQEFKMNDKLITLKALECVKEYTSFIVEELVSIQIQNAVEEYVFNNRIIEQSIHESVSMKVDEALTWTEIDLFEEFWKFYVPKMLNSMLQVPEYVKGMMEYAGMIKLSMKKTLQIDLKRKNDGKEWFDAMFKQSVVEEQLIRPMNPDKAAVFIQKIGRRYLGRKKARKKFTEVFGKRFDPSSGKCYYTNLITGETSWDRPIITKVLFPNSTW